MLLELPVDVLLAVIEQLRDPFALEQLSYVSKFLWDLLQSFLYKDVEVLALSEEKLDSGCPQAHKIHQLCIAIPKSRDSSLHPRRSTRRFNRHPETRHECAVTDTIVWDLGTCIPPEILGPSGVLQLHHQNLESIRLITDYHCPKCNSHPPLRLSAFEKLKKITWIGLGSAPRFNELRSTIISRSHQLMELNLDLVSHVIIHVTKPSRAVDALALPWLLGLDGTVKQPIFTNLRHLSLSHIPLQPEAEKLVSSIKFGTLRSLRLRNCHGWEDLLKEITHSHRDIQLKTFEITAHTESFYSKPEPGKYIRDFLGVLRGLVELYVSIDCKSSIDKMWTAALQHRQTLRSFVHYRKRHSVLNSQNGLLHMDNRAYLSENPSLSDLGKLDLHFLAISCDLIYLDILCQRFTENSSLYVLHIRKSTYNEQNHPIPRLKNIANPSKYPDLNSPSRPQNWALRPVDGHSLPPVTDSLHEFLQWAFGQGGISPLQIVAVGDFTYNGRYAAKNSFFCRAQSPTSDQNGCFRKYRRLLDKDRSLWALVDRYSDSLQACPTGTLL
ncbi:uncharacterized protein BDW43DRAFT_310235 [Aspergillus alliaceus]|uniref:uncharacterized protein n=1 Tax=Petromyces alliaceus TaxID=209559 RepID=UPI0012A6B7F0|nr:uncharacterized protein BDW43DRAFT_310235 [Aspergillus alliaceus]KAB8234572.1 hypothetical protein BDW43DRAFT_310235 [Aspergillus alliaceus]